MRPSELVESVLAEATDPRDRTQAVVSVQQEYSTNLRWANSAVTTNGACDDLDLSVTVFVPVSGGMATATRTGPVADAPALLAEARSVARVSPAAADAVDLLSGSADMDWGLAGGRDTSAVAGAATHLADLSGVTASLRDAFATTELEYYGYAEETSTSTWVGTTTGLRWHTTQSAARLEVSAKSHNRTRSAWHGESGRRLADIDPAAAIARVQTGLSLQRHRVAVSPVPMAAILTPSAVADLMVALWWQLTARDAAEGVSALHGDGPAGTAIGTRLTDRQLTLRSDPHDPQAPAPARLWTPWSSPAASVFDAGAVIGAVDWISDGVLANLITTRALADRYELPFRPSAEQLKLFDRSGRGSLDDLVARTDRALLITSLWYLRDVDPQTMQLTGLTRDGCYLVERGSVVGATGNFRFNDSPLSLLARVLDAGVSVPCLPREWGDYFTRAIMPPLLVDQFGVSTASPAI
jgi:predicted Zn-dependent protease